MFWNIQNRLILRFFFPYFTFSTISFYTKMFRKMFLLLALVLKLTCTFFLSILRHLILLKFSNSLFIPILRHLNFSQGVDNLWSIRMTNKYISADIILIYFNFEIFYLHRSWINNWYDKFYLSSSNAFLYFVIIFLLLNY